MKYFSDYLNPLITNQENRRYQIPSSTETVEADTPLADKIATGLNTGASVMDLINNLNLGGNKLTTGTTAGTTAGMTAGTTAGNGTFDENTYQGLLDFFSKR